MKTLYMMRHGQTLFNQKRLMQGWCDSPLTELGKRQARCVKEYLENNEMFLMVLMHHLQKELVIL